MKDKDGYGNFTQYVYPKEIMETARNRTYGLMKPYCLQLTTLPKLLQSAYLQGIVDTVETLQLRELKKGE